MPFWHAHSLEEAKKTLKEQGYVPDPVSCILYMLPPGHKGWDYAEIVVGLSAAPFPFYIHYMSADNADSPNI